MLLSWQMASAWKDCWVMEIPIWVLKSGFHKKYFRKSETLTSWTLFSPVFFQISADWWKIYFFTKKSITRFVNAEISTNQHWSGKKRGKKVFNSSEFHSFGSTSYEIHILTENCIYSDMENKTTAWRACLLRPTGLPSKTGRPSNMCSISL